MKDFKDICRMSQMGLKDYMGGYLIDCGYSLINGDGFLYAKGDVPVLLVAHLDTVHKLKCTEIVEKDGKLSSPQGIGGDDRCGVFMIMNIVKELHCSVLLCEDEEIGGKGAGKFCKTPNIKNLDVNYMIEFDRKGSNDAVFYSCDNKDFEKFVCSNTGFKFAYGSFSDISKLAPAAKIAAVNLSCGYYNAHTTNEYVVYDEMMHTIEMAIKLINAKCEKPFEYIEKKYSFDNFSLFDKDYRYSIGHSVDKKKFTTDSDFDLELEAVIVDIDGEESVIYASGKTKAECWADLFLSYPDVCFSMVTDYSFI